MNCTIDDCTSDTVARGLCRAHYLRERRTGSPTGSTRKTTEERFWSKVDKSGNCWTWTGCTMNSGYGAFGMSAGNTVLAHRYAYESTNTPLPEGVEIDHSCFNRVCVNPSHLRPVSRKQNSEHRQGAHTTNRTSGARGVYWSKGGGKWFARVVHNQHAYHLGMFTTIPEAESAAIAKRIELFTHNDVDRQLLAANG